MNHFELDWHFVGECVGALLIAITGWALYVLAAAGGGYGW